MTTSDPRRDVPQDAMVALSPAEPRGIGAAVVLDWGLAAALAAFAMAEALGLGRRGAAVGARFSFSTIQQQVKHINGIRGLCASLHCNGVLHRISPHLGFSHASIAFGLGLGALLGAGLPFALAEGLRRGYRWAWLVQVTACCLLALAGLAALPGTLGALGKGGLWPLVPAVVLLCYCSVLVWNLVRPGTREWVAEGDHHAARDRHDARWIAATGACALGGGILVALSALYG